MDKIDTQGLSGPVTKGCTDNVYPHDENGDPILPKGEWKEPEAYEKIMSEWRKKKTFTIKTSAYDAYFGMSSSALSQDSEFDVDDSATKAQIKRAFVKSLKTKKLNKKVLGEFIDLVV